MYAVHSQGNARKLPVSATGRRSPTAMLSCGDTTGNTRDGGPCSSCVPLCAPPHHRAPRHRHHLRGRMSVVPLGRGALDGLSECRRGVHEPHRTQWAQELPACPYIVCRGRSVSPDRRSPRRGQGVCGFERDFAGGGTRRPVIPPCVRWRCRAGRHSWAHASHPHHHRLARRARPRPTRSDRRHPSPDGRLR